MIQRSALWPRVNVTLLRYAEAGCEIMRRSVKNRTFFPQAPGMGSRRSGT
jgi:hypothetical protein